MKRLFATIIFLLSFFVFNASKAQDTLPKFNIRDINSKKILVTWINPYEYNCIQIAVQRSFDSLRYYKTIYSAQSPELPQNGVAELRMPKGVKVFYRIFYVLEGGKYFFTEPIGLYTYSPVNPTEFTEEPVKRNIQRETGNQALDAAPAPPTAANPYPTAPVKKEALVNIYKTTTDSLFLTLGLKGLKKFRDSIITFTKDTLYRIDAGHIILKTYKPKYVWKPSRFIFTDEQTNNVVLNLPLAKQHKYRLIFYDEEGKQIFEIKQPRDPMLVLDNADFIHAGWFYFDLYEDDKLKEHNKFQIYLPF